jgi:RNA polymerase sigma factor (sigma-70 family)
MTDDALLIKACLDNNTTAQKEVYVRHSPKMMAVCYRYAKNKEDAEDMLQEGFIKVFSQLSHYKFLGSFEGWIRKIIVHTCINILKKNKKFNDTLDIVNANNIYIKEDLITSSFQAKKVVECIRMLPVGYRTVLNLYAIEGFNHAEIAQMLDIKESTSRSQYVRARTILQKLLIKHQIVLNDEYEDITIKKIVELN